jgi:hypothetical protein
LRLQVKEYLTNEFYYTYEVIGATKTHKYEVVRRQHRKYIQRAIKLEIHPIYPYCMSDEKSEPPTYLPFLRCSMNIS